MGRPQIHAVVACYFVASFAALGLPPYLSAMLPGLGDPQGRLAGALYVVPTLFGAIGAPLWGRLADRYGRKRLLLRAQVGLAASFLLAGLATDLRAFVLALVLQGVLGGTYAASNGYLGATLTGSRLSWALSLMQAGARAALVLAPLCVGLLSAWIAPQRQYLLFAALPALAAVLVARLPEPTAGPSSDPLPPATRPGPGDAAAARPGPAIGAAALYGYEGLFVFATVVTYPYLLGLLDQRFPGLHPAAVGSLFAVPHLVYLVAVRPVHTAAGRRPRAGLIAAFGLIALALAMHLVPVPVPLLVVARVVLGIGMTLGLVAIAVLAADRTEPERAGRSFGLLELFSKSGAVAAGVVATCATATMGLDGPMVVGVLTCVVAGLCPLVSRIRPRLARIRWEPLS
jgi:MFS family permease